MSFFVFYFLFSLTLVQLYDMTTVFHGPAHRVQRLHICFVLVHGVFIIMLFKTSRYLS